MNDKIGMNENEIVLINDKLKLFKKEEDLSIEAIDNIYIEINNNYKTNNTDKLYLLESEVLNNLNVISRIHNDNIYVLDKKREQYLELKKKNITILSRDNAEGDNNGYRL